MGEKYLRYRWRPIVFIQLVQGYALPIMAEILGWGETHPLVIWNPGLLLNQAKSAYLFVIKVFFVVVVLYSKCLVFLLLLFCCRIVFVCSREGSMPRFVSGIHRTFRTPVYAIVIQVS